MATFILVSSTSAWAHATLIGADPAPNTGTGVGLIPKVIRLRMSEPIRVPPSAIRVRDRNGKDMASAAHPVAQDRQSIEARLRPLGRGIYKVEWRSVSALDGHTIRGSYFFGIGEAPPGAPAESQAGPLAGAGPIGTFFRVIQDASLLLVLGLSVVMLLVRGRHLSAEDAAFRIVRRATVVAAFGTLATVAAEAIAASGWSGDGFAAFLSGSVAGWARVGSVLLAAAALIAALERRPTLSAIASAGALACIGISGHAGATTRPILFMAASAAHLVFAGIWLGGAAAISLIWRRARLTRDDVVWLVGRASPFAIGSATVVAGTGGVNAIGQLAAPSDLWRTGYGALIDGKIAALTFSAAFGARHSLVLRRRLAASPDPGSANIQRGIKRALFGEGWIALAAVVFAAFLVAFPSPPAEEARSERQSSTVPSIYAIGDRPFVTVADHDGPLLISLTLAPPRPGSVQLAVQLIGPPDLNVDGAAVSITAVGPQGSTGLQTLSPCGPGCYTREALLEKKGMWEFTVRALERIVQFSIPLPTPAGQAALRLLRAGYDALRSLQIEEIFRSWAPSLIGQTKYLYEAPNRSARFSNGVATEIDIGTTSYTREAPSATWTRGENPFPPGVPFPFIWQSATEQPRLLGRTVVAGRSAHALALFDPFGIWFRILIDDATGRPLEDHMRAIGHFMDRTYSRFDQPLDIRAPS